MIHAVSVFCMFLHFFHRVIERVIFEHGPEPSFELSERKPLHCMCASGKKQWHANCLIDSSLRQMKEPVSADWGVRGMVFTYCDSCGVLCRHPHSEVKVHCAACYAKMERDRKHGAAVEELPRAEVMKPFATDDLPKSLRKKPRTTQLTVS
jgi:hypothetical protein